jgi:hypothetical protein
MTDTAQPQTTSPVSPPPDPATKPKKSRTPAQLAALAKGREAKKQKAMSSAVVKSDDSASDLVDRVRNSDPEASVSKRKRKDRGWSEDSGSLGSDTMWKVAGVAAVAGLAFLGSKGGLLRGFPVSTPPNASSAPPPAQGAPTTGSNTSVPVSLSGASYVP